MENEDVTDYLLTVDDSDDEDVWQTQAPSRFRRKCRWTQCGSNIYLTRHFFWCIVRTGKGRETTSCETTPELEVEDSVEPQTQASVGASDRQKTAHNNTTEVFFPEQYSEGKVQCVCT